MSSASAFDGRIVIIGGGQAGGEVASSLRSRGFAGELILVSDEDHLPYQRPPLSKAYLQGDLSSDRLLLRPAAYYKDHKIDVLLGQTVIGIDRSAKVLITQNRDPLPYARLALATGARARPLAVPGMELAGVYSLRTLRDVDAIRSALASADNLVIVGGGFIGMEVAAVVRKLGKQVTVLETLNRVMARVSSPRVSAFYRAYHESRGVHFRLDAQVRRFIGHSGQLTGIELADGGQLDTSVAVVGVGVLPNVELALKSGLSCDGGIVVDEFARTTDHDIVAAGDCTNHPNSLLGRRLRLESVHNAVEQARTAAGTLCGQPQNYAQIPWFWSDQYDLKLQMVGIPTGYDQEVLRGDPKISSFSIYYFKDQRLIAVDSINRPVDHMLGRRFLNGNIEVTPAQVADTGFDLKALK